VNLPPLVFVTPRRPVLTPLAGRTAALMGHIPWIGRYVKILPGVGMDLKHFRGFAMQRFIIRKNEGSGQKDLFYHLVNHFNPRPLANLAFPDVLFLG